MSGRSHLSDEELIRYLEGELTQSRAGKIVLLTQANAGERERIASLERMLALVAKHADEVAEIDLVGGVWERIEEPEPGYHLEGSSRDWISSSLLPSFSKRS